MLEPGALTTAIAVPERPHFDATTSIRALAQVEDDRARSRAVRLTLISCRSPVVAIKLSLHPIGDAAE